MIRLDLDRVRTRRLLAASSLAFCVGVHYVLKPAREAYMLQYWGTANLPWLNGAVLILVLIAARVLRPAFQRYGGAAFLPAVSLITVATYLGFPLLQNINARAASLILSAVIGLFNLNGLAAAWSLAVSSFSESVARREFGIVGLGGPIGAVCGAALADRIASAGPQILLTTAAVGIMVAMAIAFPLSRVIRAPADERERFVETQHRPSTDLGDAGWRMVMKFSYTRVLVALAVAISGLGAVFKWSFFRIAELEYHGLAARTTFFASSYQFIAILSVVVQLIVTPVVLRRFGAGRALQLLPLFTIAAIAFIATTHSLPMMAWCAIAFMSLDYTVNQCARELLYVPTPVEVRFEGKQYIDTAGRQIGVLGGNGAILVLLRLHASAAALQSVIVLVAAAWLFIATAARRQHALLAPSILAPQSRRIFLA